MAGHKTNQTITTEGAKFLSIDRPNSRFADIMKDLIEKYGVPIGVEESVDYQGTNENLQFDVNRRNVPDTYIQFLQQESCRVA